MPFGLASHRQACRTVGPQPTGDLEPIEYGHLQIDQSQVERFLGEHLQGLLSVLGNADLVSPQTQPATDDLNVDGIIFSNEDPEGKPVLAVVGGTSRPVCRLGPSDLQGFFWGLNTGGEQICESLS